MQTSKKSFYLKRLRQLGKAIEDTDPDPETPPPTPPVNPQGRRIPASDLVESETNATPSPSKTPQALEASPSTPAADTPAPKPAPPQENFEQRRWTVERDYLALPPERRHEMESEVQQYRAESERRWRVRLDEESENFHDWNVPDRLIQSAGITQLTPLQVELREAAEGLGGGWGDQSHDGQWNNHMRRSSTRSASALGAIELSWGYIQRPRARNISRWARANGCLPEYAPNVPSITVLVPPVTYQPIPKELGHVKQTIEAMAQEASKTSDFDEYDGTLQAMADLLEENSYEDKELLRLLRADDPSALFRVLGWQHVFPDRPEFRRRRN